MDDDHIQYLEEPVVALEDYSYTAVMRQHFFQGKDEMLQLTSNLGAGSCNMPEGMVTGFPERVILGRTSDNQFWLHSSTFHLQENTLDAPLADGGELAVSLTENAPYEERRFRSFCSSVPRTFLNEDTCQLSDDACYIHEGNDADILLDEKNLERMYLATGGYGGEETRYVYIVRGLRMEAGVTDYPCTYDTLSRWVVTNCSLATRITENTTADTFQQLFASLQDHNPYVRDIYFPQGAQCSPQDANAYTLTIEINGTCWQSTHPDNFQVFDMTYW
jgi:hypothetical protein